MDSRGGSIRTNFARADHDALACLATTRRGSASAVAADQDTEDTRFRNWRRSSGNDDAVWGLLRDVPVNPGWHRQQTEYR